MESEILSLAMPKVEQAEVYGAEIDRIVVEFRANEFHSQETRLARGYGLRVLKNGRIGFCASTNPQRIEDMVQAAVDTATFGRAVRFDLPATQPMPEVTTFDNRTIMLPVHRLLEWGSELIEAVRSRVPDLKLDLTFTRVYRQVQLLNSSGLDAQFSRAEFDVGVTGLMVLDGLYWINDYENLSNGKPFAVGPLADRIEQRAKLGRAKARLATGTYPVIIAPMALPNLLYPFFFAVTGKALEKGTSPLIGKTGQKLLDEKLTMVDNGLRDFALESAPFDGEGTPRRRNVLFDKGTFHGFLFDLATAAACKVQTTGSAGRDYSSVPAPVGTNVEIEPGKTKLEEAIRDIREGLLVYEVIGGGQSNIMAGDVTLNVSSGFKVENGTVTGRVKDALIAGNVYKMFRSIEAVGDTQRDLGNYYLPFVKFGGLKVATRT